MRLKAAETLSRPGYTGRADCQRSTARTEVPIFKLKNGVALFNVANLGNIVWSIAGTTYATLQSFAMTVPAFYPVAAVMGTGAGVYWLYNRKTRV